MVFVLTTGLPHIIVEIERRLCLICLCYQNMVTVYQGVDVVLARTAIRMGVEEPSWGISITQPNQP
jgi:hypothetical protein